MVHRFLCSKSFFGLENGAVKSDKTWMSGCSGAPHEFCPMQLNFVCSPGICYWCVNVLLWFSCFPKTGLARWSMCPETSPLALHRAFQVAKQKSKWQTCLDELWQSKHAARLEVRVFLFLPDSISSSRKKTEKRSQKIGVRI